MSANRNTTDQRIAGAVLGAALLPPALMTLYMLFVGRDGGSSLSDWAINVTCVASGVAILLRTPLSLIAKTICILIYIPFIVVVLFIVGVWISCSLFDTCF